MKNWTIEKKQKALQMMQGAASNYELMIKLDLAATEVPVLRSHFESFREQVQAHKVSARRKQLDKISGGAGDWNANRENAQILLDEIYDPMLPPDAIEPKDDAQHDWQNRRAKMDKQLHRLEKERVEKDISVQTQAKETKVVNIKKNTTKKKSSKKKKKSKAKTKPKDKK